MIAKWLSACEQYARFRLHLVRRSLLHTHGWIHPARAHIHAQRTVGEWAADSITAAAGSWPFVIVHVAWFAVWLALHLDINLLTLIVSLEAIFLATFVLMSQNRGAAKDRTRDDVEAAEVDELATMNRRQLQILDNQDVMLAAILGHGPAGQPAAQATITNPLSQQAGQMPHVLPDARSAPPVPSKPPKAPNAQPLTRRLSQRHPTAS